MEKAIEDIVRTYLRQETGHMISQAPGQAQVQVGQPTNGQNPEKPYTTAQSVNHDHDVDSEQDHAHLEQEFMHALYQCLEEKGVMKEIQAFIRQRLVLILKGSWPNLVQTKCGPESHVTLALIQDFLCTHKLLFTFSVFASELVADEFNFRDDFGKMRAENAQALLCELHIPKNSPQGSEILKQYFSQDHWSLLECIIHTSTWTYDVHKVKSPQKWGRSDKEFVAPEPDRDLSLEEKLKHVDENFGKILTVHNGVDHHSSNLESIMDKRLLPMVKQLGKDKRIQFLEQVRRFKNAEIKKIREEVETKLKFEYLQKEKQLLSNYEEKVTHIQKKFIHEKLRPGEELGKRSQQSSTSRVGEGDAGTDRPVPDLENFHQSLLAKYNDLIAEAAGPHVGEVGFGVKRDLERSYLLKEAALRNTIDKLKSENEQLKVAGSQSQPNTTTQTKVLDKNRASAPMEAATHEDEDARTFLQYTVECQSEQIANLQNQINQLTSSGGRNVKVDSADAQPNPDANLEEFLRASKQRFSRIDQETECVKARMRKMQSFSKYLPSLPVQDEEIARPLPRSLKLPESMQGSISSQFPPAPNLLTVAGSIGLPERKVKFKVPPIDTDLLLPPGPVLLRADSRDESHHPTSTSEPPDNSPPTSVKSRDKDERPRSMMPNTEPTPNGQAHRNVEAEAEVMEPEAIAKKAYQTGALIRDKIPSPPSSSDEHSKSDTTNKSKNGRPTARPLAVSPQVQIPSFTPSPLFQQQRQQTIKSAALALIEDFEKMETGRASSSDEDLW